MPAGGRLPPPQNHPAGNLKEFAAIPFQQVVKIPCEACNTGWMRGLEDAVIPFLTPMILGERVRLRPPRQRLLATWCVKTALVMDYLHPRSRVVPDAHYYELYRYRQAPCDLVRHYRLPA